MGIRGVTGTVTFENGVGCNRNDVTVALSGQVR